MNDTYWVIRLTDLLVRVTRETAASCHNLIAGGIRGLWELEDLHGGEVLIRLESVIALYESTPELREAEWCLEERERIADKRACREQRQALGEFDDD